jgi:hypothetical protein
MLAAALTLIVIYGSNVPTWDDWDLVPTATGHRPVTAEWLWSQHNEHRVPLPRLLLLSMMRWVAMDFRVGMYFNVLAIGVLALGMIFVARRIRGNSSYLDAFFPIVMMNWGQAINFLWCWQVQYFASALLAGVVLLLITQAARPPKLPTLAAGICIVLLPLCGANGLGLVPALALWLGYVAVLQWRSATSAGRRRATVVAGFATAVVLLVGLYFTGYNRTPYFHLTHSARVTGRNAMQFLTMGFGPGVVGLSFDHRLPMFFWKFVCAAVVGLFLVTGWMLVITWWRQPDQRARSAGLFLFLSAMGSLALGLGLGGRDGFETRYVTLSMPGLCAVYLVWTIYGAPRFQNLVRRLLFATVVVILLPNMSWGLRWAHYLKSHLVAFERDIRAGTPPYQLLQRYANLNQDRELMMDYMPMLRDAHIGAFGSLRDDPRFREVSLPLVPVDAHNMTWEDGIARPTDNQAWLTFELPSDVQVAGIRLAYTYSDRDGFEPCLGLSWKARDEAGFDQDSSFSYCPIGDRANWPHGTWSRLNNEITTLDVWVDHPVQSVRVFTLEKRTVKIHELTLLVLPEADAL